MEAGLPGERGRGGEYGDMLHHRSGFSHTFFHDCRGKDRQTFRSAADFCGNGMEMRAMNAHGLKRSHFSDKAGSLTPGFFRCRKGLRRSFLFVSYFPERMESSTLNIQSLTRENLNPSFSARSRQRL